MEYFPFFFDLRERRVLLVGGGEVAHRKAALLLRGGAAVSVVAPTILPELATVVNGDIWRRDYFTAALDGCAFVVAATDDDALNQQVFADARAAGVPINVVDNPALCDFIFPAIIDRSPLIAAVSSSGASPVLARQMRTKIEQQMPPRLGRLAKLCEQFRDAVKGALPIAKRRAFWEDTLTGTVAEMILAGDDKGAETQLQKELQQFAQEDKKLGEVYLIGAGPGAPDLLTFRAHRLLQKADVVVYDRLASLAVLDLARRDAKKIFVGKRRDCHVMTQAEINKILIDFAQQGLRVARLKGGDPFIFGRGGEELQALREANVPVFVAAGITAAAGCAAEAGIPLTFRTHARGVRFCTAYKNDMHDISYWQKLADENDTLVFYMAGMALAQVAANLQRGGRNANTPVAVICAGTTDAQRIIIGTLDNIAARATPHLISPTLIIVGEVVALGDFMEKNNTVVNANNITDFPHPFLDINQNNNGATVNQLPTNKNGTRELNVSEQTHVIF